MPLRFECRPGLDEFATRRREDGPRRHDIVPARSLNGAMQPRIGLHRDEFAASRSE